MLTGEKVILRPISFEDWEKTVKWRNDLEIKTSTMSHPFPITSEQEQEWYKRKLNSLDNSTIIFTIITASHNETIGFIHLNEINWLNRNCYFGIVIGDRDSWGKGYGKEAVGLIIEYGFKNLNLHKIYCYVLEDHPALKTYLSLGANSEGLLKNHAFIQGRYENVCVLAWYSENIKIC